MDLDRHIRVLWRHRAIVLGGIVLGLMTAFLAAYKPTTSGLERRGGEVWSSSSMVFVTQQGFPWGRVTLPSPIDPAALGIEEGESAPDANGNIPFSDPARLTQLAVLYSVMSSSDRVRQMLPGPPAPEQIEALPVDPTGRGDQFLPIIQLTTRAGSAEGAYRLNQQAAEALKRMLVQEQRTNQIREVDRVQLQVLKAASAPALESGPSWTSSMFALILCVGAAVALAHLLEGLSLARSRSARVPTPEFLYPDAELAAGRRRNGVHVPDAHDERAADLDLSGLEADIERLRRE